MNKEDLRNKMERYLGNVRQLLALWLTPQISKIADRPWDELILPSLEPRQVERVQNHGIQDVQGLKLNELLRVIDLNWFELATLSDVTNTQRSSLHELRKIQSHWAQRSLYQVTIQGVTDDLDQIINVMKNFGATSADVQEIESFEIDIEDGALSIEEDVSSASSDRPEDKEETPDTAKEINIGDTVVLISDPSQLGAVIGIKENRYTVLLNNKRQTFYREQIQKAVEEEPEKVELPRVRASLTAYQIYNPGQTNLYSLNSARVDFVPYQFRPALKMIQADEPRLLIADDVGVGKTIEAGLILKEMEARARDASENVSNTLSVLVICPKPLVTENKWVDEMKRFDENFENLDGSALGQCFEYCEKNGIWPENRSKVIVPYSLFNEKTVLGTQASGKGAKRIGLKDLNPKPHFDLVIVDEAHTIRNPQTLNYQGVEMFCQEADAVIFLTATPIQNGNRDLYTLLHLLRPDIVTDEKTFESMSEPNTAINRMLRIVRAQKDNWQEDALKEATKIQRTKWGREFILGDPDYQEVLETLNKKSVTREERVALIEKIEGLHSFNTLISRTRRRDIGEFCIRRTETEVSYFTPTQQKLYDKVLDFDERVLKRMHGAKGVSFMMTTIMRQAASCIYGLAPFLEDIVNRKLHEISRDGELYEYDELETFFVQNAESLYKLAEEIKDISKNLPEEDPKIDKLMEVLNRKKNDSNPRVIVFSSFRHTLSYIRKKLEHAGYRVEQIDGSVKDEDRRSLRARFEMNTDDPRAIDIMLFSEVGCEGLDYQFCNTMVNYDLPWNPMRIEQRIGRIDRRGQRSAYVDIHNMITDGTIDADIYSKCLSKIDVFNNSIGDCGEILGDISNQISEIMFNPELTREEQREKLEQLADNDVRKVQEMRRLEDEEKELYGFDLSRYMFDQDIQNAENRWISPDSICSLVNTYLKDVLGSERDYILGKQVNKTLRLSADKRQKLYSEMDFRNIDLTNSSALAWKNYLKSRKAKPICSVTFDSDYANEHRDVMFLTQTHPLVMQAAAFESQEQQFPMLSAIEVSGAETGLIPGDYPFLVYSWRYTGIRPDTRLVAVCANSDVEQQVLALLQTSNECDMDLSGYDADFDDLEGSHYDKWDQAKKEYLLKIEKECNHRLECVRLSVESRITKVREQYEQDSNEHIRRLHQGQMENLKQEFAREKEKINDSMTHADILYTELVKGVLYVN